MKALKILGNPLTSNIRKLSGDSEARAAAKLVYDTYKWRMLAKKVVQSVGYCERCGVKPSASVRLAANHIVPLFLLGAEPHKHRLAFDRNNINCLCYACNNKQKIKDRIDAGLAAPTKPKLTDGLAKRLPWLDEVSLDDDGGDTQ
jgi:hypothetical protein